RRRARGLIPPCRDRKRPGSAQPERQDGHDRYQFAAAWHELPPACSRNQLSLAGIIPDRGGEKPRPDLAGFLPWSGTSDRSCAATILGTSDVAHALTRREWLAGAGALAAGTGIADALARGGIGSEPAVQAPTPPRATIGYCLNTSTLRGQKLTIAE